MNSVLILSLVLMSSLNSWVESEEFCQAFRGNNYRISYTYLYYPVPRTKERFIEVIINGKHWTLKTNNNSYVGFVDSKHESQPSLDAFKGNYQIALTICKTIWTDCSVLLINTNTSKASILNSSIKDDMKTKNLIKDRHVILNGMYGKPFAAFQVNRFNNTIFIEYDRNSGQLDAKAYDLFALNGTEITAKNQTWNSNWKIEFLKSKIGSMNLLSLIYVYVDTRSVYSSWYILLWEKDAMLWWCLFYSTGQCIEEKLLIDCSPKTNGSDSSLNIIVIIVVLIVLIILLIIGITIYLMQKRKDSQNETQFSTEVSTEVSTISGKALSTSFAPPKASPSKATPTPNPKAPTAGSSQTPKI